MANASKYRVKHRSVPSGRWTTDDDTITGTAHTVDGLACRSRHVFQVSAYGSGTVYAAAWSEPSVFLFGEHLCVRAPNVRVSSCAFSVNDDAAARAVVGSASATGSGPTTR